MAEAIRSHYPLSTMLTGGQPEAIVGAEAPTLAELVRDTPNLHDPSSRSIGG